MKRHLILHLAFILLTSYAMRALTSKQFTILTHSSVDNANLANGYLIYHPIQTDKQGKIIPCFSKNQGYS